MTKKMTFPYHGDATIIIDGDQAFLSLEGGTLPKGTRLGTKLSGATGQALLTELLTARLLDQLYPAPDYDVVVRQATNSTSDLSVTISTFDGIEQVHLLASESRSVLTVAAAPGMYVLGFDALMDLAYLVDQIITIQGWSTFKRNDPIDSRFIGAVRLLSQGVLVYDTHRKKVALPLPNSLIGVSGSVSEGETLHVRADNSTEHALLGERIYTELMMTGDFLVEVSDRRYLDKAARTKCAPEVFFMDTHQVTFLVRSSREERCVTLDIKTDRSDNYVIFGASAQNVINQDYSTTNEQIRLYEEDFDWARRLLVLHTGQHHIADQRITGTTGKLTEGFTTQWNIAAPAGVWTQAVGTTQTIGGHGSVQFDPATGSAEVQYVNQRQGISVGRQDYARAFAVITDDAVIVRILEAGDENTSAVLVSVLKQGLGLVIEDWLSSCNINRKVLVAA